MVHLAKKSWNTEHVIYTQNYCQAEKNRVLNPFYIDELI